MSPSEQPTPASVRADKPVDVLTKATAPARYYSVEEVNIQMDEHRWWSVAVTETQDEAMLVLHELQRRNPDGIYRVQYVVQVWPPAL